MKTLHAAWVAVILSCGAIASAPAATITFDTVSGPSGALFSNHSEAGFSVSSSNGQVFVNLGFGNPAPSLFGGPLFGPDTFAVTLTRIGGGTFTFDGYDVASNGGSTTLVVLGRLAGTTVLSTVATQAATNLQFVTRGNSAATLVDTLVLSFTANGSSTNFDNIRVTAAAVAVPEPATVALLLTGIAGLGAVRRRRAA